MYFNRNVLSSLFIHIYFIYFLVFNSKNTVIKVLFSYVFFSNNY